MEYLIYLRIICLYMAKLYHSISMEKTHYNRIKAVLTEKDKTGMWLAEQMDKNVGTVSRWTTNKIQPSVEQLYVIAKHLDVDVRELLVSSK